jgi:glutathione peroxidase-family protein
VGFREGSPERKDFQAIGEPAKQFTNIGSGPKGMTVKAAADETHNDYLATLKKIAVSGSASSAERF